MTKAELRRIYLAKQKDISPADRMRLSREIAERFFAQFDLSSINFLHCFIPIEKFNEIDTTPIFQKLWTEFPRIKTLVPRVNFETGSMEGVTYSAGTELIQNKWGIGEPAAGELFSEEVVDLVLVPGIAFDADCHRVGYGKGFYDRFLRNCRSDCVKVGASYFPPVASIMDIAEHDVRLDHCLTPGGVYTAHDLGRDSLSCL